MNGKDTDPPETKITKGLFKGLAELKKYPAVAFISASFGTVMALFRVLVNLLRSFSVIQQLEVYQKIHQNLDMVLQRV